MPLQYIVGTEMFHTWPHLRGKSLWQVSLKTHPEDFGLSEMTLSFPTQPPPQNYSDKTRSTFFA